MRPFVSLRKVGSRYLHSQRVRNHLKYFNGTARGGCRVLLTRYYCMSRTSGNHQQGDGERYQSLIGQKKSESRSGAKIPISTWRKVARLGQEVVRSWQRMAELTYLSTYHRQRSHFSDMAVLTVHGGYAYHRQRSYLSLTNTYCRQQS